MARVLICWELGNGLAYIEGLTLGANAIRKAGHEVIFAVRDLAHADRLLSKHYKYYQAPTTVISAGGTLASPMTFADVLINLGYGDPDAVAARVRAWRNLIDQVRPDIVRCAHAPGAMLAARGTRIRSLAVGIGFLIPPSVSPLPLQRTWFMGAKPERMAAREQRVLEGMNRGLDAVGAPRLKSVGALYGEADQRLIYTYPELDDYGPRQDVLYAGNFQPGRGAAPVWPAGPGKRIFAYLEPVQVIGQLLQALADTRQPVLAYLPHAEEALLKRYSGSNLRLVSEPLDLMQAAAACDIGVSHAGHNIAGTFMGAGKPQLCVPLYYPEMIIAQKVAGLGSGLIAEWRAEDLTRQLARLLQDGSFADKAQGLLPRISHLNMEYGLKLAASTIDELVAMGPRRWDT